MSDLGMVYVETGEAVGQVEADESHSKHSTARDVSRLAKTILQLTAVLGLGPTGANGMEQNEQCRDPVQDGGNDMTWIWISIIILTLTLDRICSYSMDNVEETHGENGS